MKYLNDPQISLYVYFENEIDSFLSFLVMALVSTFLCECVVDENSLV